MPAALTRVERGVKLGATGDDLAELRVVESEARYWKGEYVEAERAAREAINCVDPKLALRAMSALIDGLGPQAKYDDIAKLADGLEVRPAQPELLNAWLGCKYYVASYLASAGEYHLRTRTLQLLEAAREDLDPILVGRMEAMKAHLAKAAGHPGEAAILFQHAAEFFEKAGHRRAAAETLGNFGCSLMEIGQLEEAEAQMRKLWATA